MVMRMRWLPTIARSRNQARNSNGAISAQGCGSVELLIALDNNGSLASTTPIIMIIRLRSPLFGKMNGLKLEFASRPFLSTNTVRKSAVTG